MNFETLAHLLISFPENSLGSGATEEEIQRAERDLGLRIFGAYREFLRRFGWGGVEDFELYGLGTGVPSHLNLVNITQSERSEMEPHLPRDLLPIMNDGGGNLYCLNTCTGTNEPAIVSWYHDLGYEQTPELVSEDFASWVTSLLPNG
jgi:hypothetical protein